MKEVQDDQWVGKIKELLEDFTPINEAGDWKQVKQKLSRSLPWGTRLLMFFRKPWILTLIFGIGILAGYLLFYSPDKVAVNQTTPVKEDSAAPSIVKPSEINTPAATVTTGKQITSGQEQAESNQVIEKKTIAVNSEPSIELQKKNLPETSVIQIRTDFAITFSQSAVQPVTTPLTAIDTIKKQDIAIDQKYDGDTVRAPGAAASNQPGNPGKKLRKPIDLSALSLNGDPWKIGIGYDYLFIAKPDTGHGTLNELSIHFDNEVAPKLWVGSGLTFGRTFLTDSAIYRVSDWLLSDSLGYPIFRDSVVNYQRWQNHMTLPIRATYDLFRNRTFAIPLSAGVAFGWTYNQSYLHNNDGQSSTLSNGPANGFTGFITMDFRLGCEIFYLKGLSAVLSADYRRMIAGPKAYGFKQNFIGGTILLNLDFDKEKWR